MADRTPLTNGSVHSEGQTIDALFDAVRTIEPPPGAFERVSARLDEARHGSARSHGFFRVLIAAPMVAALAVLIAIWSEDGAARVLSARRAVLEDGAGVERSVPFGSEVSVGTGGHLRVELNEEAAVSLEESSRAVIASEGLTLTHGRSRVRGDLRVDGAGCAAHVEGESEVEVVEAQLVFTVFAGSVEMIPPTTACRIIELSVARPAIRSATAPTRPGADEHDRAAGAPANEGANPATDESESGEGAPGSEPETSGLNEDAAKQGRLSDGVDTSSSDSRQVGSGRRSPRSSAQRASRLAREVEAYREAMALREVDDVAALERWRAFRRAHPRSAMRHEVDVNVIDALVRLGRTGEARREAERFLRRYPKSPRRDEMRELLEVQGQ